MKLEPETFWLAALSLNYLNAWQRQPAWKSLSKTLIDKAVCSRKARMIIPIILWIEILIMVGWKSIQRQVENNTHAMNKCQHRESPHLPETLPYTNSSKLLYAPLCFNNSTAVRLKIMQSTCLTDQQGNLEDTGHFFKLWPMNEPDEEVNFSETLFFIFVFDYNWKSVCWTVLSSRHNLFNNSCVREHNFAVLLESLLAVYGSLIQIFLFLFFNPKISHRYC